MSIYYYEIEGDYDGFQKEFNSDAEAIAELKKRSGLEIIYKESETKDGTPFVTVWIKS